ncbi:MAG: hypothetical protein GX234_03015 [Clostridiales bacterium]|nr:hypothetical protein [Clostridiales bacterium]
MRLKNILFVVKDIEKSKAFYRELFGLQVVTDFGENDIDGFLQKLENSRFPVQYVNRCMEHDWGQRVIRIYDPDKHIIEIGEALEYSVSLC